MRIEPFAVEQWMNEYETRCAYNLAETCVESLTVAELLDLAGHGADRLRDELLDLKLTYGAIEGSERLRQGIAGLYDRQAAANVLITHGAIGANHLVHLTLVEPGDRVVTAVPNYQQHTSIPASIGADVRPLRLRSERRYLPDLDELADLVGDRAKLVVLTNPNNPTGSLIDRETLEAIVAICSAAGAWLLCDEVYRGIDQDAPGTTASVADLYERGISTGSMSKAFSLAGLRLGWIAGPTPLIGDVTTHRDYNTISVGMIDDHLACLAVEHAEAILGRNRDLVRANNAMVDRWVDGRRDLTWIRPAGGTTGLLRYTDPIPSRELCVDLLHRTGVLLTPGSAIGAEGSLRIGYANTPSIIADGLDRLGAHLDGSPAATVG
ncbi:MAG: aminotransferase class I/II-fold pyridoxal phosphate-dependent enzyme [Actinomycetota bacterium]